MDNYCLEFEPTGVVNLGQQSGLPAAEGDYTLQFWFLPTLWTPKAALVRSGTFSIKLGNNHALVLNDGTHHLTVTDRRLGEGKWCHVIHIICITLAAGSLSRCRYLMLPASPAPSRANRLRWR